MPSMQGEEVIGKLILHEFKNMLIYSYKISLKLGYIPLMKHGKLLQITHKFLTVYLYFGSITPIIILPLITMYLLEDGKDQLQNNS
jgi:hypothetical protein